jgi:hypothetical protein
MAARFKKGNEFLRWVKKNPTVPLSAATLGVSLANLSTNAERRRDAEKQNREQIKAMNKLSDSMSKVSASFDDAEKRGAVIVKEKDPKKTKKFRIGFYSEIVDDLFSGAAKGTAAGVFVNGIALAAAKASGGGWGVKRALSTLGYSVILGSALGLVIGITKKLAETSSRNQSNQRVINTVCRLLKNKGFEENKDFTRDPKIADQERTKITVVVNRGNGDLKLALNVISDEKLEKVCNRIISELPDKSKTMTKESNRYNEIMITTLSSGNDAIVISGIIEKFIRAGYPVYMIEVG